MTSDPFLRQLADLCRAEPTTAKWVVVRSHAVGRTLADRLALEGTGWSNLRFVTPFSLALDTAAPFLLERGLDPLPDGLGGSLAMRLLLELPPEVPSYFRPLADQPRMGSALWSALRELRLSGLVSAGLSPAAFEDGRKHDELQALLGAYESYLATHKLADAADVYRAAASRPGGLPVRADDRLVEAPGPAAAPLVRAFLDALPGRRLACAVPSIPGVQLPRRLQGAPRAEQPPSPGLAYLLAPAQAPPAAGTRHLQMFHAAGLEAEVEGVFRRLLSAPSPLRLDQVEVACASSEQAHLFWEKAQRLDLPVTIEHGVPVTVTRPGRALLGVCAWADSNFVAGRLRRLLQSGDLRLELPGGGGAGQAARLLLQSEATWGRQTYERALAALAGRLAARADEDERDEDERAETRARADRANGLRQWVAWLLSLFPAPDDHGDVSVAPLVQGLSAFVGKCAAVSGPIDAAAVSAITRALADLRALDGLRRPLSHLLGLVRNAVEDLVVDASPARPGHLHVSMLASAGYAGRAFTFVTGLQEGDVFPRLLEDPVLLDAEREAISADLRLQPPLPHSHDRLAEAVYGAVCRLAVLPTPASAGGVPGGVCLSYSCRDLRDGRETFPSWLMLQALRLEQRDASLTYEDLQQHLGTPETLVAPSADAALTDAGWWVCVGSGQVPGEHARASQADVLEAFPSLAAGREAMEARESSRFTKWDGLVAAAGPLLDPRLSGKPASVTRIERLVSCPFRYFLEYGLGLEVVDDDELDQDEWLDRLQRGAALHQVYADLGRMARERGTRLDPKHDRLLARRLAESTLQALREACPPPSDVVFDRERAEFVRDVELFLEFEAERPGGEPVAFEVAFGHEGDGVEPLARLEPVAITLGRGESFLLRGTIDRIQRLPDGGYEVIDYKTGGFAPDKWRGTFRAGAMLQHALYGLAAATLLRRIDAKPRIAGGVYEFPSAAGGGERVALAPPGQAVLVAVLCDLFGVMADGAFVAAHDAKECRYCDFTRACGQPTGQARAKLDDPDNVQLEAYRRLQRHE